MNRSLLDTGGEALIVSQFTLYGDARKGRRPSFIRAAAGPEAEASTRGVVRTLEELGVDVGTGEFGATMQVSLTNDGPVTILLDSRRSSEPSVSPSAPCGPRRRSRPGSARTGASNSSGLPDVA